MSGLIAARLAEPAAPFVARLARRAARIAEARIAARRLAERGDGPDRWRQARLLWPLFAKD